MSRATELSSVCALSSFRTPPFSLPRMHHNVFLRGYGAYRWKQGLCVLLSGYAKERNLCFIIIFILYSFAYRFISSKFCHTTVLRTHLWSMFRPYSVFKAWQWFNFLSALWPMKDRKKHWRCELFELMTYLSSPTVYLPWPCNYDSTKKTNVVLGAGISSFFLEILRK